MNGINVKRQNIKNFPTTPNGSKTKGETQISTYASAVERKYRVSLRTSVFILSDKYGWSLPAATQPCVWSVSGVGCAHTIKKPTGSGNYSCQIK
jgi:hypothetical protein